MVSTGFRRGGVVAAVVLALMAGAACATVQKPTPLKSLTPADLSRPADWEYKIQVGDELDVKFYFNSDLNEHIVVRPDGRISLQLIPELVVTGLTPRELTEKLKQEYSHELGNPELAVIMRTFSAQRVFVGGEVGMPGEKPLVGPMSVLQAIAMAQGFKDTAKLTEVVLIRRRADGRAVVLPLNLKAAISGVDVSQDLALMPYDVVHVPRSSLATADLFVDQAIKKMIPVTFGFRLDRLFWNDVTTSSGSTSPPDVVP
jgi:protein involved in polysaccharide export with SLBB domain